MRLLHVFELRDSLIAYENAWFDSGAVRRQADVWHQAQESEPQ